MILILAGYYAVDIPEQSSPIRPRLLEEATTIMLSRLKTTHHQIFLRQISDFPSEPLPGAILPPLMLILNLRDWLALALTDAVDTCDTEDHAAVKAMLRRVTNANPEALAKPAPATAGTATRASLVPYGDESETEI
ncbi:hypothetical protein N7509_013568 [Penicillium cosmopolitanum]|uniref:Uncharacterized protein n=1 Tax=Penicillium cosmopolitanum TaxID=1131564 RepID=A0A9W9SEI9_9EURO|nr:uncharacterized protein N7509_013568 [Penicillium cosmopolitanum]KAJ5376682.1 hypothetical protein N7509_013568 [Penicillium cosmopolitanum]